MQKIKLVSLIFLSVFIIACSTNPFKTTIVEPDNPLWHNHKAQLLKLNHWILLGRFGAKNEEESWSGNLNWRQNDAEYEVHISAPLSGGSFILSGNQWQSTLQVSENDIYSASDGEVLLARYTGLHLPVNNLRYWLIGLPSPNAGGHLIEIDESGRIVKLNQQGWQISFHRYQQVNEIDLPNKIFLENHEFNVRLVIQSWDLLS